MIVDGKKLAEEIKTELKAEVLNLGNRRIRLAVVKVGENLVTEKFLSVKKKFGNDVGIDVRIYEIPEDVSTNKLREKVSEIVHIKENDGVIVQLPLPSQINTQYILDALIPEKDLDMLSSKSMGLFSSGRSKILPPVVASIDFIFKKYSIDPRGKRTAVIGAGRLVGKPVATWLINQGAAVSVADENTSPDHLSLITSNSDILVSGVGKANIISADMVSEGIVAIDCGTSVGDSSTKSERALRGDIDPAVAEKASLFSPVPGGVGPLTVAMLFKNLVELSKKS